jgi:hypothetical protein
MSQKRYFKLKCLVISTSNSILRIEDNPKGPWPADILDTPLDQLIKDNKVVETDRKGKEIKQSPKKKEGDGKIKSIEEFQNKGQLMEELDRMEVECNSGETRADLYSKYQQAMEG